MSMRLTAHHDLREHGLRMDIYFRISGCCPVGGEPLAFVKNFTVEA